MLAICDVDYRPEGAVVACVLAADWGAASALREWTVTVAEVAGYEPGNFAARELPCLVAVLAPVVDQVHTVIVDGYVWLGPEKPGLGARLHQALGGQVAVVGVAKTRFAGAVAEAVVRGSSRNPLQVTSIGMEVKAAAAAVAGMHGPHRIPTLIKRADGLARGH
jgi:deoxyribonuclease V